MMTQQDEFLRKKATACGMKDERTLSRPLSIVFNPLHKKGVHKHPGDHEKCTDSILNGIVKYHSMIVDRKDKILRPPEEEEQSQRDLFASIMGRPKEILIPERKPEREPEKKLGFNQSATFTHNRIKRLELSSEKVKRVSLDQNHKFSTQSDEKIKEMNN